MTPATKEGYFLQEETGFSIDAGQALVINSKLTPNPEAALLSNIWPVMVDTVPSVFDVYISRHNCRIVYSKRLY